MKEATFNTEIINSLEEQGAFAYKIPDQPASWNSGRMRFTPSKPCDTFVLFRGFGALIEGKQMKKFEAFGLRHLRPSQIVAMDRAVRTKNRAYIFLNVRCHQENRLIIFEWSKEFKTRLEKASIKGKEIKSLNFVKGFKKRFDLSDFLEGLTGRDIVKNVSMDDF